MAYEKSTSETRRPSLDATLNKLYELAQSENIADDLDDDELSRIGKIVKEEYDIDKRSREEWEQTANRSMEIALQVKQSKNFPFENASNVKWPLITVAALQFNARAYPAIVDDAGIVKAKVVGDDPDGVKREKADRIGEHMSYQLKEEMDGWEEDMDTLLIQLPIVGDVVKKVYRGDDENKSEMIAAVDFVVNNKTKSLRKCPRMTHRFDLYPYEVEERVAEGRYRDCKLGDPPTADSDKLAPHEFLEQHRRIDLDGDGYGEPYIVTVHKETEQVVAIVANFSVESVKTNASETRIAKIIPDQYFVNFVFIPDPKGGFYGIGFGSLLENLSSAIDTTVNQMIDAATLQNAGGGFFGSGVRLKKGYIERKLGKWIAIDAPGAKIREAMVPFEDPGPSAVLFNLLGMLVEQANRITSVQDILTGETPAQETATTTLARIEQGLKVFTAIYKRVYRALREEFRLLFGLNAEYLDEQSYYNVLDTPKAIAKADYDAKAYDVCPVADPKLVTDMQRMARAQALMATFEVNPNPEILRRYYVAIGAEDVDALMPQPNPAQQAAAELEMAGAEAEVEKTQSETSKNKADVLKTVAEIAQGDAQLGLQAEGQAQDVALRNKEADNRASEKRKAA